MTHPRVEITAVCEVHQNARHLVVRREGDRLVLDANADECCVIAPDDAAAALLIDVLGECLE